jgi:phage-related protein
MRWDLAYSRLHFPSAVTHTVIYAVQLAEEIWVIHAFQKKSPRGIKTPKREVDLIRDRLNRLREMLG